MPETPKYDHHVPNLKALVRNLEADGERAYDHLIQAIAGVFNTLRDDAMAVKNFAEQLMAEAWNDIAKTGGGGGATVGTTTDPNDPSGGPNTNQPQPVQIDTGPPGTETHDPDANNGNTGITGIGDGTDNVQVGADPAGSTNFAARKGKKNLP
jgi:hypothetical protein